MIGPFAGGAAALGQSVSDIDRGRMQGQEFALRKKELQARLQQQAIQQQLAVAPQLAQIGYDAEGHGIAVFVDPRTGQMTSQRIPLEEGERVVGSLNLGGGRGVVFIQHGGKVERQIIDISGGRQDDQWLQSLEPLIGHLDSKEDQATLRDAVQTMLGSGAKKETVAKWAVDYVKAKQGEIDLPASILPPELQTLAPPTIRSGALTYGTRGLLPTETSSPKMTTDAQGNVVLTPPITTTHRTVLGQPGQARPQAQPPQPQPQGQVSPVRPAVPPQGAGYPPSPAPPAGGGGGTPGGRVIGHKAVPPQEQQKLGAQNVSLASAIELIGTVRQNIDVFNSVLDAGKIQLAIDHNSGELLVSRLEKLTPKEETVAAAFQQLAEHINLLRGPMSSTGFRGPEAFAALQAMRGQLLAQPGITYRVLTSTEKVMRRLMDVNNQVMSRGQVSPVPVPPPMASPAGEAMVNQGGAAPKSPQTPGAPPPDKTDQLLDKLIDKYSQ